ncbi:MAG: GcvT family protein [Gammaproteobacteria bacterium]
MSNDVALPAEVAVVVVGGGVVGCAVAYHLAQHYDGGVLLLERGKLTCGTTWHAAGLMSGLRATPALSRIASYTLDLCADILPAETGLQTGFHRRGSLALALSDERWRELLRLAGMAKITGANAEVLSSAKECAGKAPHIKMDGVIGGLFLPEDGQADPANVALAMAKAAKLRGADMREGVAVLDILQKNGKVCGVKTNRGIVKTPAVALCAGLWSRDIAARAGASVPLMACEHFYVVTEPIKGLPPDVSPVRVFDECAYYKEDAGKLLIGAFEPVAKPWDENTRPDFCFDQLPEDADHFAPILEQAIHRAPALATTGISTFFNGPESFTSDGRCILGEAPSLSGLFVAAGMNSQGIQLSGGVGKVLAQWMVGGEPPCDLWEVDIRRFHNFQRSRAYLRARTTETPGLLYADHFPHRQMSTARGIRRTPLYAILKERGACFGEYAGWERANWFSPDGKTAPAYRYSWLRQNWFRHSAAEHLAMRENVGLLDLSTFGKLRLRGADAADVLQKACANNIDVAPGKVVYTQMLNRQGGVESDATIARLDDDDFLYITGAACTARDLSWLRRQMPPDARCIIDDMTAAESCIGVFGPGARELLNKISPDDFSAAGFAFGQWRNVEVGMALARAHRISYVGELGWELHIGADFAAHLLECLLVAGGDNVALAGMHAMDSCRLEKGFRHFGHDLSDEDNVLEAGLAFAVKTEHAKKCPGKYGDFIGREAVLRTKEKGLQRRMVQIKLQDAAPLLYHYEPILRDGEYCGYLTSGNYGHFVGAAVGMGYVKCAPEEKAADVLRSAFAVEVGGEVFAANASIKGFYDPDGKRMKG